MPSIYVNDDDFNTIVSAVYDLYESGKLDTAAKLDVIGRKINCSLSRSEFPGSSITWESVPSILETIKATKESIKQ